MPRINDIGRLKTISRRMLKMLEQAMNGQSAGPPVDRLFGPKQSLAEALAMVGELILKLDKVQKPAAPRARSATQPFSPADIELVEAVISKAKETDGNP